MTDRLLTTQVPHELHRLTGQTPPTARAVLTAATDARIPAQKGENGRWTVARADLPLIAARLCPSNTTVAA